MQNVITQSAVCEDEEIKIGKLKEHLDMKRMVIEIAEKEGVYVKSTYGDDKNGDVVFDEQDTDRLIEALDKYLYIYKVK